MSEFKKTVEFTGGFDRRDTDPAKNYGIGAVKIRFILQGKEGAVQWMIGTNWYPETARQHLEKFPARDIDETHKPTGWDLGYHSPKPMYEGQEKRDDCHLIEGGCYYDGSSSNADRLIEGFINGGDKYIWQELENYYRETFEKAEAA